MLHLTEKREGPEHHYGVVDRSYANFREDPFSEVRGPSHETITRTGPSGDALYPRGVYAAHTAGRGAITPQVVADVILTALAAVPQREEEAQKLQ